jgi:hypothetical protein
MALVAKEQSPGVISLQIFRIHGTTYFGIDAKEEQGRFQLDHSVLSRARQLQPVHSAALLLERRTARRCVWV